MTLQPLEPHLKPMIDALEDAERQKRALEERQQDEAAIRRAFEKGGMSNAKKVGRAFGWDSKDIEQLVAPPPPQPRAYDNEDLDPPGDSPPPEPSPDAGGGGASPWIKTKKPVKPLPEDCPVIPLGTGTSDKGVVFYYLTPNRQLVTMENHGADHIRRLFAGEKGIEWLFDKFPKFRESGPNAGMQNGWKADSAADSLTTACGKRGPFNPARRLRGVGAWRSDDDTLILHAGQKVLIDQQWRDPGFIGDHVYPGDEAAPMPVDDPVDGGPAETLLKLLDTWPWDDGRDRHDWQEPLDGSSHRLASILILGWIGCAMIGGALKWRPMIWITGDAGSGKSTLQHLIEYIMGSMLVASSNATPAGIYNTVGYSSRAVAIDEAEPDVNSVKMKNMMDLVRQSASGGVVLRGSAEGKGRGFTARSSFFLSSILIPPMESQDSSRVCILRLGRLTTVSPLTFTPQSARLLGRQMLRRIMDGWPRWHETLELYRSALANAGHDARGCDQFGTLLAMSDLLRGDETLPTDCISGLIAPLAVQRERQSNAETMLRWLLSMPLDNVFRGGTRVTVNALIRAAADIQSIDGGTQAACIETLKNYGIFVEGFRDSTTVTLPNQSAGLARLFDKSMWGTTASAVSGGWAQAMRRLPGAESVNSSKLGGRGWRVPIKIFLLDEEGTL